MKRFRRMVGAALAAIILCCCGALSEAEDPVVVRVGDISYTEARALRQPSRT